MAFACNLCHGLMSVTQPLVTTTPCGHIYHNTCVNSYFQEKDLETRPICPCCQHELNVENGLIHLHPLPYKRNSSPLLDHDQDSMVVPRTSGNIGRNLDHLGKLNRFLAAAQGRSMAQGFTADSQRSLLDSRMQLDDDDISQDSQVVAGLVAGNADDAGRRGDMLQPGSIATNPHPPSGDGIPLIKVGNDIVFTMDGRVINVDQLVPANNTRVAHNNPSTNDLRDRYLSRQQAALFSGSTPHEPPPHSIQRRALEHELIGYPPSRDLQFQGDLDNRSPPRFLPPAPTSSSSMWGVPSWQMGAPWRAPPSNSQGNNVHRMDNVQYYPSPFIREPAKQQPPFPIQIPFHRPTTTTAVSAVGQRLVPNTTTAGSFERSSSSSGGYEGNHLAKRKASPSAEQYGGSRPNIETGVINYEHVQREQHGDTAGGAGGATASCTCCPPPNPGSENRPATVETNRNESPDQDQDWDSSQQQQRSRNSNSPD